MKSLSKLVVSLILLHVIVVSLSRTLSTQRYFAEESVDVLSDSMTDQQPVDENIHEGNLEIIDNIIDEKDDTLTVEEELQGSGSAEEELQGSGSVEEELFESTTVNDSTNLEEAKVSGSLANSVLYSGINGTSNWKIFEGGLLLIGSGELTNNGNESPWSAYASEITDIEFEVGVYAPAFSSSLFKDLKAISFIGINNFDTSRVISMYSMFEGMSNLQELDVSSFDTSRVTDMRKTFEGMSNLQELDVSNFNTSRVTQMSNMFSTMTSLQKLDLGSLDTSKVRTMSAMFSNMTNLQELDVSNFDTSSVTQMNAMFTNMTNLQELDVSNFDTSKVTIMSQMFDGMSSLLKLDISNFDTSNVTNMYTMFKGTTVLSKLDVSNFDTSNVTNMYSMFSGMRSLLELDVRNFDTSNATTMNRMFERMSNLQELDVSNFDTSNVTDMYSMFDGMSSLLGLNLSNFDTSKVTAMRYIFRGMSSLLELDVSNFDTSKVNVGVLEQGWFFNVFSLRKLTLGSNFSFNGINTQLPTISKTGYTGRWIGTTTGQIFENSLDLATNFAGQADTYIWEKYVEVHPPETNPAVTIPPTVPSSGPLTIAYASQLNFGEQMISSKDQTYSVLAEMHELTDKPGQTPYVSFAQIQDTRVNNKGWSLSVTASEFASNTQNNVLEGAQITLGAPTFIHTGSTDEGISVHDGVLNLIPGASSLLMKSEKRGGTGITSIIWGDQATLSNSVDEKVRNDAIQLAVPGSTTKDATTYKATLSWELMATPSNEI